MSIQEDGAGKWQVESESGSQYVVELVGTDRDDPASYTCSCPAGKWGKTCKHVRECQILANQE